MAKYTFRLVCALIIVFLAVPFLVSLGTEPTYTLPLGKTDVVSLEMPDGVRMTVSRNEFFIGTTAAFLPNETDKEVLRAAYVMINTPELLENGILYLSEHERTALWGDMYDEKLALYSDALESVQGQSLLLASDSDISLSECMDTLALCEGDYTEKLAALFPGGGLKTEK